MAGSPAYYPVIVISDAHLGIPSNTKASEMLTGFLRNTDCDTLILNGDIIDGVRREDRHVAAFPEKQKEVLDIINQKIAGGTKVYYLPGNHDTKLRDLGLFGKTVLGINFEPWLSLNTPDHRRLLIAHGDNYRGEAKRATAKPHKTLKSALKDHFYTAVTRISLKIDTAGNKFLHRSFHLASRLHAAMDEKKGLKERQAKAAFNRAQAEGYDGIIYGHFHQPDAVTSPDGHTYMNGGDWVENFTALTMDAQGQWNLAEWPKLREEMRLAGTFKAKADKSERSFRPQTERMVAAVQTIWPGL